MDCMFLGLDMEIYVVNLLLIGVILYVVVFLLVGLIVLVCY